MSGRLRTPPGDTTCPLSCRDSAPTGALGSPRGVPSGWQSSVSSSFGRALAVASTALGFAPSGSGLHGTKSLCRAARWRCVAECRYSPGRGALQTVPRCQADLPLIPETRGNRRVLRGGGAAQSPKVGDSPARCKHQAGVKRLFCTFLH